MQIYKRKDLNLHLRRKFKKYDKMNRTLMTCGQASSYIVDNILADTKR